MTQCPRRVLLVLLFVGLTQTALAQRHVADPAFQALRQNTVYVAPDARGVDAGALRQAASPSVKVAVLANLPPGPWRSRDDYAGRMHHALHLDRSALVLVVLPGGQGGGVSLFSNSLQPGQARQLTDQYVAQIKDDPTAGTAALAQAVRADLNSTGGNITAQNTVTSVGQPANVGPALNDTGHGGTILLLVFLIVAAVVAALIVSASRRRKADLTAARGPVEALRANVLSGIEYIDHYTDVLPHGNPDSEVARTARQAAEDKYEQASQVLARASSPQDLNRAQGILDRAQADIQQARGALDRALGGTKNIPGDDAFRPPPLPQNQEQVSAIPQAQRGVSFFSGEPAPLGSLVPVTVTVGGQQRQVYATPEEAAALRAGRMPQVRAFNVNNRYVPWYEYNAYDPYRDYWRYENSGWGGGFGGGALAGFIGAELLMDSMMPAYGYGGYGGYAFSPEMSAQSYDQGFAAGQSYDQGYAAGQGSDQGGGTDFGNDPGNQFYDYGGGDSGGGTDFGGGDFGGGSDFGGGGDSGGGSDF